MGNSPEEIGEIAAFGSIILKKPLVYSHSKGALVEQLPADPPLQEEEEEEAEKEVEEAEPAGPDRAAEYAALAEKLQAQADAAMEALKRAREQMAADREQTGEVSGGGDALIAAPTGAATGAAAEPVAEVAPEGRMRRRRGRCQSRCQSQWITSPATRWGRAMA